MTWSTSGSSVLLPLVGHARPPAGAGPSGRSSVPAGPRLPAARWTGRRGQAADGAARYHRPVPGCTGRRPRRVGASTDEGGPVRTLVIAGEYPWPDNSGSRLRLATVLRGLARVRPDRALLDRSRRRAPTSTRRTTVRRPRPGRRASPSTTGRPPGVGPVAGCHGRACPFELPVRDGGASLRALARFASRPLRPRLVLRHPALAPGRGDGDAAPAVLDLVDLEDHKIAARMAVPAGGPPGAGARAAPGRRHVRSPPRRSAGGAGSNGPAAAHGWRPPWCAATSTPTGRAAGGMPRVEVVPNGYRLVARPGRHAWRSVDPPVVLFQGTLRYPPNAEAARFLVDEVAPRLRRLVPDVRIRLVGTTARRRWPASTTRPAVDPGRPGPRHRRRAGRADLVVVPLRFGSGTRLKVLEAFAHRVPVVSTTLGAEGLGARDGVHLLVADTADDLAVGVRPAADRRARCGRA